MKTRNFTTTNDKGQIVIPKEMREGLGVNAQVTPHVQLAGNGIYIYPVDEFILKTETENSYIQLLEKTKGCWKDDSSKNRSLLEFHASELRKDSW